MSDRWTLNALAKPAFRQWHGETVVHHLLSNDTHRLAEPVGWILGRLAGGVALTADQLATGGPGATSDLEPALEVLDQLGLLVRC